MIGRLARRWKDLQGGKKRTRRARFKGWRPWSPNALSAHPFSGASCETLWRSGYAELETRQRITRAPASQSNL